MLVYILLSILYLVLLGWLTYESLFHLTSLRRLILKTVLSSMFFVLFFVIVKKCDNLSNSLYFNYIGALGFSFLGDLLLGIFNYYDKEKKIYFYIGTLLFFAAQVFYIAYFGFKDGISLNIIHIALPLFFYVSIIIMLEKFKVEKKMIYISSFYCLAVSSMFTTTLVYGIYNAELIVPIAGFSFLISDFTLALKYFYNGKKATITILTTVSYYLAQLLFILYLV